MVSSTSIVDNESLLQTVDLKYVYEEPPGYKRVKRGRGFSYLNDDGALIKDPIERKRLISLAVPPTYDRVWYCPTGDGHLQATGYDSKSNKQYFYHQKWELVREATKFYNLRAFGNALPKFRRKISKNLSSDDHKEMVLAAMGRILDRTGIRVGSENSTAQNKTYGLTTLEKKHVETENNNIEIDYIGKGGVEIERALTDARVTSIIDECIELPGQRLFEYQDPAGNKRKIGSTQFNDFIKDSMGDNFSAKNFRTWRFSCLFLKEAQSLKKSSDDITLTMILDKISEETGNTPAVLKSSYIHPGLLQIVKENSWHILENNYDEINGLRQNEMLFLNYLKTKHAENTFLELHQK